MSSYMIRDSRRNAIPPVRKVLLFREPQGRAGFSLRGAPDPKVLAGPLYMGGEILRGKSLFQSPNAFSSPVFRG